MIRRQSEDRKKDDPFGEALAGGPEQDKADRAIFREESRPLLIDLDEFVTTPGDSSVTSQAPADPDEDEPVVAYDDEARGGRVYHLLHAPRVDGGLIDRVTMRMPEQGDIDAFFSGEIAGNRGMICRLTGLHPSVFARLKWPDAAALHQIYRDIVPAFVTGEE